MNNTITNPIISRGSIHAEWLASVVDPASLFRWFVLVLGFILLMGMHPAVVSAGR